MSLDLDAIEAKAISAKEYECSFEDGGVFDCPLCGEGQVDGVLYDAKNEAGTIAAFGIGNGLILAKKWVEHGPADTLALVAQRRARDAHAGFDCAVGRNGIGDSSAREDGAEI